MPIILNNIINPEDVVAINNNFDKIEKAWDEKLDRFVSLQGNEMNQDLDMNGKAIINVHVNDEPRSLVNKEYVDGKIHSYEADSAAQVALAKQYAEESLASSIASNASALLSSQEAEKAKLAAETAAVDTSNVLRGEFVQLKEAADASAVRAEVAANNAATMTAAQLNSKFTMLADNAYDSANRAEHQVSLARIQALRAEDAADKAAVDAAADVRTQFEGLVGQATTQADRAQTEANRATIAANTAADNTASALRGEFTAITERAETAATSASSNSSSAMLSATAAKLSEEAADRSKVDSEKYRNDAALSASQALTYSQAASSSAVLAGQEAARAAEKAAEELEAATADYLSGFVTDASEQADRAKAEADRASQITGLDTVEEAIDNALARDGLTAMTKEDFFALAEKRKRDSAGSGLLEWGKQPSNKTSINQGLWEDASVSNTLYWGTSDSNKAGTSRTDSPISLVNGAQHNVETSGIKFPPAPNGTKTYDSTTGVVVQHSSVEEAFGAETETNKVITTRKDLCFLETWHEAIDLHDLWNPLGNVQFSATSFDGITGLSNTLIAQGYSAFGEWDTTTKGYGKKWSSMTLAEKTKAIQNPDNNIYFDAETGKYIQVKYRIRAEEGTDDVSTVVQRMAKLGYTRDTVDVGKWTNPNGNTAIGICLVQRLNQGASHPVYNSEGCGQLEDGKYWYNSTFKPTSTKDCFTHTVNGTIASGKSGRPTIDPYKFYDAIYAGQVEDLRLSANKQDYSRLLEDRIRKAVAGETRGKGKVPFFMPCKSLDAEGSIATSVYSDVFKTHKVVLGCTVIQQKSDGTFENTGAIVKSQPFADGIELSKAISRTSGYYWVSVELPPEYDILPWVDIIGPPENIAATFPNGVVGQWVPQIPTGIQLTLNRKCRTGFMSYQRTLDDGLTWAASGGGVLEVSNKLQWLIPATPQVILVSYETLSNFTVPADSSVVVGEVGDVYTTDDYRVDWGNRLLPSLTSSIGKSGSVPSMSTISVQESVVQDGLLLSDPKFKVAHTPIPLPAPQNNSSAVKTLYNLTSKDGLLYIQYHGNELKYEVITISVLTAGVAFTAKVGDLFRPTGFTNSLFNNSIIRFNRATSDTWPASVLAGYYPLNGKTITSSTGTVNPAYSPWDGSGWGDDSTIPIINGEGTMTNLNGEKVKTFCHTEMIPIGIADFTEAATASTREVNFFSLANVPTEMRVHYVEEDDGTLTRLPFYFENGGHIDDAEVARYELFQEQHEAYIQANYEEYESRTPEILI